MCPTASTSENKSGKSKKLLAKLPSNPLLNSLILTVAHAPTAKPSSTNRQSTTRSAGKVLDGHQNLYTYRQYMFVSPACRAERKTSSNKMKHQRHVDYFYSLDTTAQTVFLENALQECRHILSKTQCMDMLDDYKVINCIAESSFSSTVSDMFTGSHFL